MTNLKLNLWPNHDGVEPRQSLTDHPSLTQPNPLLLISQFATHADKATVQTTYEAPIYATPSQSVNMLQMLEAIATLQTTLKSHPYYNLAIWNGNRQKSAHVGQTAITLEYDVKSATLAAESLNEAGVCFYIIPTTHDKVNCYLLAIPLLTPCSYSETLRLGGLIAQVIGVTGLTPNSHKPDYLFKLRSDSAVHFLDGTILDPQTAITNAKGTITMMSKWIRSN